MGLVSFLYLNVKFQRREHLAPVVAGVEAMALAPQTRLQPQHIRLCLPHGFVNGGAAKGSDAFLCGGKVALPTELNLDGDVSVVAVSRRCQPCGGGLNAVRLPVCRGDLCGEIVPTNPAETGSSIGGEDAAAGFGVRMAAVKPFSMTVGTSAV